MRYKIVIWHGESDTIFYIVDTQAPEEEQPCILHSFFGSKFSREYIDGVCAEFNKGF